jgi:hypothetical protein
MASSIIYQDRYTYPSYFGNNLSSPLVNDQRKHQFGDADTLQQLWEGQRGNCVRMYIGALQGHCW